MNHKNPFFSPHIMGIINTTPDSFYEKSRSTNRLSLIERCDKLLKEGATIIDIGGESTRPGFSPVSYDEEKKRVIPAIIELKQYFDSLFISVDTQKSAIADAALKNGANMINDIWGLQNPDDPKMAQVISDYKAYCVIMHNRKTIDSSINIIKDIETFFLRSLNIAKKNGIPKEKIILDPGIGFGKTLEQNYIVLKQIKRFKHFCMPILLGTSRKSLYSILDTNNAENRLGATVATTYYALTQGVTIFRVHDVQENYQAIKLYNHLKSIKA